MFQEIGGLVWKLISPADVKAFGELKILSDKH